MTPDGVASMRQFFLLLRCLLLFRIGRKELRSWSPRQVRGCVGHTVISLNVHTRLAARIGG